MTLLKRICITCVMILCAIFLKAQSAPAPDSTARVTQEIHFDKYEIESEFPGGLNGWTNFLSNNLVYPPKAVRKKIEGQVVARFIVEKDGSLSDIHIVSGPKELWPAVMEALNKSPNWKPAIQNGKIVKSYKSQPINFRLERQ